MKLKQEQNYAFLFKLFQDFNEVMGEIEAADGATCDLFWKDMVASGGTGNYNMSNDDFRAIFMGKLEFMEPGKYLALVQPRVCR